MADKIVSWGGFDSKGTSGMGVTGSFQVSSSANSYFVGGGSVGIGTITPSASLHISGASSANLLRIDSPASSNIIYVSGSGNIGIGTSSPATKLDLVGSYKQTQASGIVGLYYITTANADQVRGTWDFYTSTATTPDFFGRFGFKFEGGVNNVYRQFQVHVGDATTPKLIVNGSGNVGIGTTSPTARLHTVGTGTTSATTTLLVQNNAGAAALTILDDKSATFGGDVRTNSITNYYTGQELLVTSAGSNSRVNMVSYGAYSNYSFRLAQYYNYSTTGSYNTVLITDGDTFYSTGSAANTLLTIAPAINSQGGSHIYRGIYINPSKYNNPQFTDLRAIETTAGNIIVNGGSVGIGISTPSSSLHISGASAVLTLSPQTPLPSGVPTGSFAVSSSVPPKPYFYDGTTWNALY